MLKVLIWGGMALLSVTATLSLKLSPVEGFLCGISFGVVALYLETKLT